MALMSEPIVGIEKVVYDDATGSGAIPARPLTSPKSMSAAQRAVHDITHMPYHPGCEICESCRRPNTQHRSLKSSERTVPLMVGDYAFPKHSEDSEPMTVLVIRVFPYKRFSGGVCPMQRTRPTCGAALGALHQGVWPTSFHLSERSRTSNHCYD